MSHRIKHPIAALTLHEGGAICAAPPKMTIAQACAAGDGTHAVFLWDGRVWECKPRRSRHGLTSWRVPCHKYRDSLRDRVRRLRALLTRSRKDRDRQFLLAVLRNVPN